MKGVEDEGDALVVHFDAEESGLLAGLVDQLSELLTDEDLIAATAGPTGPAEAAHADPFALWEAELASEDPVDAGDDEDLDPVVERLFPDAYRGDAQASREFRRFTAAAARDQKVADARTMVRDLFGTDRRNRCRVPRDHVGAWLKTLTNLRLTLAARLGIVDEVSADEAANRPEGDPRAWMHEVYSWLGWLQESLLQAL